MLQPSANFGRCSASALESDGSSVNYLPYKLPEAFAPFGLNTSDWSMEIAAGGPRFTTDVGCFQLLLYALVEGDAALSAHFEEGRIERTSADVGYPVAPGPNDYWKAVYLKGTTLAQQHNRCATMACNSQTALGGTCS